MRDKTVKPWLLAASIAALLTPCISDAAGLGRLAVLSALGQPLNAEIEIIQAQKGESIVARLAPYETYQQANVQYNPALVGTRLSVEKRPNGQLYLKATTPRPISEPFVELVVELNSENGRVTRQYTILLDPPGYGRGMAELPPPAPAAVRPPVTSTEDAPAPAAPVASSPAPAAPEADVAAADSSPAEPRSAPEPRSTPIQPAPAPSANAAPVARPAPARAAPSTDQYGPVKPGENLFGIARSVKPEGATVEQTLVGIFRNNPDAFIKKI